VLRRLIPLALLNNLASGSGGAIRQTVHDPEPGPLLPDTPPIFFAEIEAKQVSRFTFGPRGAGAAGIVPEMGVAGDMRQDGMISPHPVHPLPDNGSNSRTPKGLRIIHKLFLQGTSQAFAWTFYFPIKVKGMTTLGPYAPRFHAYFERLEGQQTVRLLPSFSRRGFLSPALSHYDRGLTLF